ncbi:MAG: hypothetical protein NUV91_08560, partial [Candidatus Omnitrophica bacterium]|nr:hypothetical protein [Candidatus Omnitrophota bacterium]
KGKLEGCQQLIEDREVLQGKISSTHSEIQRLYEKNNHFEEGLRGIILKIDEVQKAFDERQQKAVEDSQKTHQWIEQLQQEKQALLQEASKANLAVQLESEIQRLTQEQEERLRQAREGSEKFEQEVKDLQAQLQQDQERIAGLENDLAASREESVRLKGVLEKLEEEKSSLETKVQSSMPIDTLEIERRQWQEKYDALDKELQELRTANEEFKERQEILQFELSKNYARTLLLEKVLKEGAVGDAKSNG